MVNLGFRVCRLLVLLMIFVVILQGIAETPIEPHVDPNKISGRIDPISIVIVYFNIFERLQGMDFNTTLKYLEELNRTTIPEDIKVIMNRLNDLIHSLTILLNKSVIELDKAEEYIEEGKIDEANKTLTQAAIYIFKANNTLTEVKNAWIEFEKNIGRILPEDYRPRFSEYTAEIDLLFKRLNKLLMELKQKQEKLRVEVEQALVTESKEKTNTSIIVYNYSYNLKPGGLFYICGAVLDQFNNTLPNKYVKIYVYVENTEIAVYSTKTNSSGIFCVNTTLPEKYYGLKEVPVGKVEFNASIYVIYIPSENEEFAGSSMVLQGVFSYIKTIIRVEGPTTAYPGSNISFRISIEPVVYGIERNLLILLDGKPISNATIPPIQVNLRVTIPYNVSVGQHFLNFTLLGLGEYSPASYRTFIIIKYIPIYVNIQYPQTYVYPLQQGLTISGRVVDYNNNPLVNAYIEALGYNTSTNTEGYFNLTVQLEKISIFGGHIEFNVTIKPNESWYPTINKTVRVNYVNLYIVLGTILYIVLMITIPPRITSIIGTLRLPSRRITVRPKKNIGVQPSSSPKSPETGYVKTIGTGVIEEMKKATYAKIIESRGGLEKPVPYDIRCSLTVQKYVKLLKILEKKYGSIRSGETIWEYIRRIIGRMPPQIGEKLLRATYMVYKDCFSSNGLTVHERKLLSKLVDWVKDNV